MSVIPEQPSRDPLMRRIDAAKYVTETYGLPCSPKTLAKIACVASNGPPFHKAGRIPLYPKSGLDAWALSKIGPLVRSTSKRATSTASSSSTLRKGSRS